MNKPIIDPSTLTELQRNVIKAEHELHKSLGEQFINKCGTVLSRMDLLHEGCVYELEHIFGKELFNDKEK